MASSAEGGALLGSVRRPGKVCVVADKQEAANWKCARRLLRGVKDAASLLLLAAHDCPYRAPATGVQYVCIASAWTKAGVGGWGRNTAVWHWSVRITFMKERTHFYIFFIHLVYIQYCFECLNCLNKCHLQVHIQQFAFFTLFVFETYLINTCNWKIRFSIIVLSEC